MQKPNQLEGDLGCCPHREALEEVKWCVSWSCQVLCVQGGSVSPRDVTEAVLKGTETSARTVACEMWPCKRRPE